MFLKSLAYGAFGASSVVSFSLLQTHEVNNQIVALVIFLIGVAAQALIFWAVTRERFKNLEEWKKGIERDIEKISNEINATNDRLYEIRTPGLKARYSHRVSE